MCSAKGHVRFTPNSDHKSDHKQTLGGAFTPASLGPIDVVRPWLRHDKSYLYARHLWLALRWRMLD